MSDLVNLASFIGETNATLAAWLRASDLFDTHQHGDTVTAWTDRMGLATTLAGPLRFNDSSESPCPMPAVEALETTCRIQHDGVAAIHSAEQIVVWVGRMVNSPRALGSGNQWLFNLEATNAATAGWRADELGQHELVWRTSGAPATLNAIPENRPATQNQTDVIVWRKTGTQMQGWINGFQIMLAGSTGDLDTAANGPMTWLNHPTTDSPTRMALYEAAIINGELTDDELIKLMARYQAAYRDKAAITPGRRVVDASALSPTSAPTITRIRGPELAFHDGTRHLFACPSNGADEVGIYHATATLERPDDWTFDADLLAGTGRDPAGVAAYHDGTQWVLVYDDQSSGSLYTVTVSNDFQTVSSESVLLASTAQFAYRHPSFLRVGDRMRLYVDRRIDGPNAGSVNTSGYGNIVLYDFPADQLPTSGNLTALNGGSAILTASGVDWHWNGNDIGRQEVEYFAGKYWLLADGFTYEINSNTTFPHSIGLYVSDDGITGWRSPINANPLLSYFGSEFELNQVHDPVWDLYRLDGPAIYYHGSPGGQTGGLHLARIKPWVLGVEPSVFGNWASFIGLPVANQLRMDGSSVRLAAIQGDTGTTIPQGTTAATNTVTAWVSSLFRLALRSDAGVVTDEPAAVAAINEDKGSGAGTFAVGQSQQAIRTAVDEIEVSGGGGGTVTAEDIAKHLTWRFEGAANNRRQSTNRITVDAGVTVSVGTPLRLQFDLNGSLETDATVASAGVASVAGGTFATSELHTSKRRVIVPITSLPSAGTHTVTLSYTATDAQPWTVTGTLVVV